MTQSESQPSSHGSARGQGYLLSGIFYLLFPHTTAASTSKAEVVLLGGSHSAGPFQGNKGAQTKVDSPAGSWKAERGLAIGRVWDGHSGPGRNMGRAWCAGNGWVAGCGCRVCQPYLVRTFGSQEWVQSIFVCSSRTVFSPP